ncbi:MAG: hypothetical protein AB8B85_07060, partial [Paracoccaceae bacterium]
GGPGSSNLIITANSTGAVEDPVRFGDLVGAASGLGDVLINRANGVTFGDPTAGPALLDQVPDRDVFFATNILLRDVEGVVRTIRSPETDLLQFDFNLAYFGLNLDNNLDYNGNPGLDLIDLTGAINGQRSQSVGLLPVGPRGANFQFNNCQIGNVADCSNEPPTLDLPQIDLSLPNIFEIDFETLGDVYANFGNEELWTVPALFDPQNEQEGQQ